MGWWMMWGMRKLLLAMKILENGFISVLRHNWCRATMFNGHADTNEQTIKKTIWYEKSSWKTINNKLLANDLPELKKCITVLSASAIDCVGGTSTLEMLKMDFAPQPSSWGSSNFSIAAWLACSTLTHSVLIREYRMETAGIGLKMVFGGNVWKN